MPYFRFILAFLYLTGNIYILKNPGSSQRRTWAVNTGIRLLLDVLVHLSCLNVHRKQRPELVYIRKPTITEKWSFDRYQKKKNPLSLLQLSTFTKVATITKKEFANDRVYAGLVANVADKQDSAVTPAPPQEADVGLEARLIRRCRRELNYITGKEEGTIVWKKYTVSRAPLWLLTLK